MLLIFAYEALKLFRLHGTDRGPALSIFHFPPRDGSLDTDSRKSIRVQEFA